MKLSAIGIKTNAKGLASTLADDVVEAAGEVTTKLVNKNTDDVISEASAKTAMGAPRQAKQAELVGGLCFVAGTKIKTITGDKNIEDIEPGDLVFAKNTVTGETGFKPVKELFLNEASELVRLEIADEIVETTYAHPFWVAGYGFKAAGELAVGDLVESNNGALYPVQSVETIYPDEKIAVYNFKVEDWHTYYVTETGILVHNSNCSASSAELSSSGGYKSGSNARTRLPRSNGHWSGEEGNSLWYSDLDVVNKITGGEGIPFINGRPDFSKWSKGTIPFKEGVLNGTKSDFNKVYGAIKIKYKLSSNEQARQLLSNLRWTPHHLTNNKMILVPTDLHGNIPHIGSASDMRIMQGGK